MEEKNCPICGENIRSDAKVHEFCKLCGMGIPDPELAPRYKPPGGDMQYFCCKNCLKIYKNQIDKKQNLIKLKEVEK
jgi:predicted nucleic acid-binding Zn ribbon protein